MTTNTYLIKKFQLEASNSGVKVLIAADRDEAEKHITELVRSQNITSVVKSSCPLAGKLGLFTHMKASGLRICETSLVKWTLQLKQDQEVPLDEVATVVSSALGEKINNDPESVLMAAQQALKAIYKGADLGISEADFGIAETGTLITLENENNSRLADVLPRLHLTLLEAKHVVESMADAAEMIKQNLGSIPGYKMPALITGLNARNTTAYIPYARFPHTRCPEEEYILLIYNI